MARESVATPLYLPMESVDRIGELAHKSKGIVRLIGLATSDHTDGATAAEMDGACWAVRDMIEEMKQIATARRGEVES